jgi:general secretion pathway protein L
VRSRLVIQLLNERVDNNGVIFREFCWADIANSQQWPRAAQRGDGNELLAAVDSQSVLLLIPGSQLVSFSVPYRKKEARYFIKSLPYQIEDDVLGDVDALHFAVSSDKESATVCAAYTNLTWLHSVVEWLSNNGLIVESCIPDFQCLAASTNELVLWFNEGYVWGHRGNGLGFSIVDPLAKLFLKDLLKDQKNLEEPWVIKVYVEDAATADNVKKNIMPSVNYDCIVGGPLINFQQDNQLNFSRGSLGEKLPVTAWWGEVKALVTLAAAALAIFFVANFADIYWLQKEQVHIQNEIVESFRQVVPSGSASVPVRRLNAMLGSSEQDKESSRSIYLLSKIAPVLTRLNIDLTTVNYSNREQVLRINIKANSFSGVEQLRQALGERGVAAELQSSNATDNGFQARLKISMSVPQNG